MKSKNVGGRRTAARSRVGAAYTLWAAAAVGTVVSLAPKPASAMNLYDGRRLGNDLEINLDTTVSYTGFYRVNDPSAILTSPTDAAAINTDEGDIDFRHGIVGNLFEVVPVFDLKDGNYGAHVSGEVYLNTPYLQQNQNNQPQTLNSFSPARHTDFTSATRNSNGENARLLDAFAYGGHDFADGQSLSLKVGRQTLLWGQSLFFPQNGIASGQAPVDAVTGDNLANPQSQQVFLPVGQAVVTYQPISGLTLQAYYQFEWQPDFLEGVGGYFNRSDTLDKGGQRTIASPGNYFFRIKDNRPPTDNGQFGASIQDTIGAFDVGLYGLRFDAKTPEVYIIEGAAHNTPNGFSLGNYQVLYARKIQLYGASLSTAVGPANVAGEVSVRRNQPLDAGSLVTSQASLANASSAPLYPLGTTLQAQASTIYISPSIPFDPGGVQVLGEIAYNHLISVQRNRAAFASGRQGSAVAFDVEVSPTYYNVLPNLVLSFPVSVMYDVLGRSPIDASENHGTGQFTAGISATYRMNYIIGLTYKDFFGKADPLLNPLADRGYVALNMQHTF